MVALETDDVFNAATLQRIRKLTEAYEGLEGVRDVVSLTNILDIKKIEGGLEVGKLVDVHQMPETEAELKALKDYHEALLDEIASVAGISKATIYLYFENKIDLFISVAERKLLERSEVIQKATMDYTDPVATIKRLIADELSFFSENTAFFKVLYAQRSDFQLGTQEKINRIRKRVLPLMLKNNDAIAKVIRHGQESGVFNRLTEGNDFGAKEAAFMLTSIIHTCVLLWILQPENANLIDKSELAEMLFLEGLLVRE